MASYMDNVVFDEFNAYVPDQLLNLLENPQGDSDSVDSDSDDSVEENVEESDDSDEENTEVVSHKFLAVISPTEGAPGTMKRRDAVNKRKKEFQHFLQAHYNDNVDDINKEMQGVISFDEFENKLGSFFKGLDVNDLATVFYLGHGSSDGALCFNEGKISCKEALTRIQTCFHDNKPKEMLAHQCRVVFAQCHAHHVDGKNEPGVVHAAPGGIEYIYFTCDLKPKTHTRELESKDTFLRLHHDLTDEDVNVRPPRTLGIIRRKLAALKRKIKALTPKHYKRLKTRLAKYFLDGPPEDLQSDICKEVNEARKNLKMFLQIVVQQDESSSEPDFSVFDQHTDSAFTVKQQEDLVRSEAQFHKEVDDFLNGSAQDIILPVILVSGKYVGGEESCNRKLVFVDEPEAVALDGIFQKYINADKSSRRMLFMGRDRHSGNTVTPPFRNDELDANADAVLGDGPKNKIEKRPPTDFDEPTEDD